MCYTYNVGIVESIVTFYRFAIMREPQSAKDEVGSSKKSKANVRKTIRIPYKSQMTDAQEVALKKYFYEVKKYPSHDEKIELAEKLNLCPYFVNKWIHRERKRWRDRVKNANNGNTKITIKTDQPPQNQRQEKCVSA